MSQYDLPEPGAPTPIADVSYRNYDGPLHSRAARWWIVALAGIRIARPKPAFWILAVLGSLPYLIHIMLLMLPQNIGPLAALNPDNKYATHFYQAFQNQQFWIFLMALLVGAGSIAADNQANALLVYLAKPITRTDYLLGKWMGIFLLLFSACAVPAILLYAYCYLSYADDGFTTSEPRLWLQMLGACAVPAALQAGLLVGFSAWSKTPRMAGATYAGFYLVTGIAAGIAGNFEFKAHSTSARLVQCFSVGGVSDGLAQALYHVTQHIPRFHRGTGQFTMRTIPIPAAAPLWGLFAALLLVGLLAAAARIRAVEVVRG